jgi:hypothetical protein
MSDLNTQKNPWGGPDRRAQTAYPAVADVRLTDETIEYLEQKIAQAVRDGIKGAMTEDTAAAFWGAGLQLLQKQATQRAGQIVIGGLGGFLKNIMLFLMLGSLMYTVGGWTLLSAFYKSMFGSGS